MPKLAVSLAVASAVTVFAVLAGAANDPNGGPETSSVESGPKTCPELLGCCGKIKDKSTHNSCVSSYEKNKDSNAYCNRLWEAYASYCDPENAPKPKPAPVPKPRPAP